MRRQQFARRLMTVGFCALVILPQTLDAQRARSGGGLVPVPQHQVGGSFIFADPVGEFANFVDQGFGLSLFATAAFGRTGALGLRFEGMFVNYGSETVTRPFSSTIQRVSLDVTTTNNIVSLGVGPQLTLGTGAVRPYLYATGGFAYFATESSVSGSSDVEEFASTTNFDDFTFAATAGGGVKLRLSRGKNPVALDFGVHSQYHGRTSYLREGSLRESADGTVTFTPITSDTNLVVFKLGVSVGVI